MYFNRKNAEQKNWRMIKKGKHFLFGCSLVFAVGASLATQVVHANTAETTVANNSTTGDVNPTQNGDGKTYEAPAAVAEIKPEVATTPAVAAKLDGETAKEVKALDKTKLENYIAEIEAKLADGAYANKTEESVAVLKTDLETAKATLANATTQAELKKAYSKLVTTVNSKLKNKPVEKKETPTVDTTNGKETVGKQAENTEPKSESNSIENTGSNDLRNNQPIPAGIQFRAEVAVSQPAEENRPQNNHYNTNILNDINGKTDPNEAKRIVGRVTDYKIRYNKDENGKITTLDWLVFFNNHSENLDNTYGTDGGEVYRNYIQIPKEVNMPDTITRAQYASPRNPKFFPGERLPRRYKPNGEPVSASSTFDKPTPDSASGLPREGLDTFNLADWPSTGKGRSVENLATQLSRYFKSAADEPATRDILKAAAINDDRLIVDRSTTGGSSFNSYVWSFTTTVPNDTTNEQLQDMKVIFGMMRSATAGANGAFINVASNPVNMWKSDIYTPTGQDQTVKVGQQPDATKSIGNLNALPQGTTVAYKEAVDTKTPGEKQAIAVVTYPDTSTKEVPVKVIVEKEAVAPAKPVTPQPEAPKPSTPAPDAATNNPAATPTTSGPEIVNDLAGKASTPADVTVKAPAGSTVKLYNTDGVVIGEAVANAQGVATIHPTNSLPAGEITATSTPAGGKESAKSTPITVTASPVTEEGVSKKGDSHTQLLLSKHHVTVYPGDKIDIDVWAEASPSLEEFSVPQNAVAVAGVAPEGHFFSSSGGETYKKKYNKYKGTVADTQKAGNVDVGFIIRNKNGTRVTDVLRVTVLETAKKYEPVAGTKVDVADPNKVSEDEKNKIIDSVKTANPNLPANATYSVDEKGNLTITYPDGSKDKVAAAYLVNPAKDTTAPDKPVVNTDLTGKAGTKTPVEVTAEKGSTVALYDKDNNKIGEATAGANGKATITPKVDIPAGPVTAKATDAAGNTSVASDPKVATPARENVAPTVSIPYSDPKPSLKEVYLYNGEEADVDITFNDDSGKIKSAALKRGGNQALNNIDGNPDKQDNEFGYTVTAINSETATPAKIKVTGQVSGIAANKLPKTETDSLKLVTRFATATDTDGAFIENNANRKEDPVTKEAVGTYLTDPGAVTFVLKAQTKKYDIKTPASADKVTVSDANNVTDKEFEKIKEKVKVEYSQNNPDARLADKKGKEVEDTSKVVDKVEKEGNKVVVTYKDGSKDTKPLSEFVNVVPTVEVPYSNAAKRQIYVYTGEKTDLTFTGKDETEVKDLYLRGPVNTTSDNAASYGLTTGKVENGAVTGEGTVSADKRTATIKMTGTTNLNAGQKWTSFIEAKDSDNAKSMTGVNYNVENDDDAARQQKPGYVQFIVKSQTDKYDIKTPTEKVAVTDPANVTEADLAKIKEKLQLEYKQDNDDANIAKNTAVDKNGKIKSVAKDNAGNLVVTYTDDSTDTKPLSEFVTKKPTDADKNTPTAKPQTVKVGDKPKAEDSIGNVKDLPKGTKVAFKDPVDTATPGEKDATVVVTYPDGSKEEVPVKVTVKGPSSTPDTKAPAKPEINTDLTDKAGTKTPVEVSAEPGSKVELFDKDGNKIGEGVADENGKATITPTRELPAGDVTAKATDPAGNVSEPSVPATATKDTTAPAKPEVKTDLTDKAGTKTPVEVSAEPGSKVELFDKDGHKIGEGVAGKDGKATITPTKKLPAGDVTAKATDPAGNVSEPSTPEKVTGDTKAPAKPEITTDLTDKAGTKTPVEVSAEPGSKVELFDKDGHKIAEGVAGKDGKATITPTKKLPAGDVTAKATDPAGNVSEASTPATATGDTKAPAKPAVTPVVDPSNLTEAEKAKVADEVKKSNPTVTDVKVGKDGTTTVTFPDGTTAVIPSGDTVKKSSDNAVKDPAVTPVVNPSNLTEAEKAKVAEAVKKANPTVTDVKVGKDGTTTVTFPDGTTAVIPSGDTVKKSSDNAVKDPAVTPVVDPSNLTEAEKAKVADEVKKSNPTVTDVKVGKDGTSTVTFPDGSTAVIPSGDTVKKSSDNAVKDPAVTPVVNPSNLTEAEKAKVAEAVKKSNPTVTDVKVGKDGTITVTFPDGTIAVIPSAKAVKKSSDNAIKDPAVTRVVDPSNLTEAEKAKVAEAVKKANPTVTDVKVGKDGTITVTFPDGTTAVIPSAKAVKKSNPTVTDVNVGKGGTTAVIPANKADDKSKDADGVKDPSVTLVVDPSNLTEAEKAKVAEAVKKSNPTATDVKVGKDGTTTVTFPDGTTAVISADKAVTSAEQGSHGVAPAGKAVTSAEQDSHATTPAKKAGAKELPNTGTADSTVAMVAAAASALLGLGLAGRRRKEDEEA